MSANNSNAGLEACKKALGAYKVTDTTTCFDAFLLYPIESSYIDGLNDWQWFSIWGLNGKTKEKRKLGYRHDLLWFWDDCVISRVMILADGATAIFLRDFAEVGVNTTTFYVKRSTGDYNHE